MKPLIFCILLSANLSAQTLLSSMEDSIKVRNIQEVSIVSRKKLPEISLLALPSVSISKSDLEVPSIFTPADALQREAGISLTRDGIWATSVNVRGLSKERILILSDGERIQTATDIAAALSTIDMNSLERIEIIKGAGSVLYGTGAMGGVINFITEHPTYTDHMQVHGRAGVGFNTVNNLWTSHAKVQVSDHNWFLGVNGSYRNAQNTKTPVGILDNSQFEDWSVGLQGGMTYGDSQELLVDFQHYEANNVGLPGGESFPATAEVRYTNVQRNLLSGEYIFYEPADFLKSLRIKAYTQNISRDVENKVNEKTSVLPSSTNTTSGAKIITDWDLLTPYQSLIVGVEGWLRDAETKRYKTVKQDENKLLVTREQPVPDANMLDLGLFAQYSWKIHPTKLTLDAGLRLDYIRTKNDSAFNPVAQYIETNGKKENVKDLQRSLLFAAGLANEFSYAAHLDLTYRPAQQHKLVLSLSNAYRAASLEERFKYIDLSGTLSVGNPNLKPEQGGFSNLSYQFAGDRVQVKADIFANYLFNLITPQVVNNYTTPNGEAVSKALVNTNIDEAFFLGAELEASYWILNNLWLTANAGYVRGRDVKDNEYLPQIPPLKGMAEINYRFRDFFTATISTQWAGKQSEVADGENTTDGYATLNVALQSGKIKLQPVYLQFYAGVDNILNTEYYNHINTTRGIVRAEPGRNFYVKVQLGW